MEPRISVVVPTYQRGERVERVVVPLLADPAVAEVVVVVDGSTDDTMVRLERLARLDPRLRVVWRPNAGAAAARQAGVQLALCEVVLLLDDDVLPGPGLAAGHLAEHVREPGRVVVGSMPTPPVVRRRSGDVTTVLYAKAYDHATRDYLARPDHVLDAFWSGNVSLPRALAAQVEHASVDLPRMAGLEDHELGLRLRAAGVRASYVPELAATHLHQRSLDRFAEDSREQGRAMQEIHRLHPGAGAAPTGEWLAGKLPVGLRHLVLAARRSPAAARRGEAVATQVVRLTGSVRLWWAQDRAVVVLQRIAQADGARAWAQAVPEAPRPGFRVADLRVPSRPVPDLGRLSPAVPGPALELLLPAAPDARVVAGRLPRGEAGLRYDLLAGAAGAVVLVPHGDRALRRQVAAYRPTSPRAHAVAALRAAAPTRCLTVSTSGDPTPPVVVAACPDRPQPRCCLVLGGGGLRRRAAFLVAPAGRGPADRVVKCGQDASVPARAAHEQDVLARVAALSPGLGPRPLGTGATAGWAWSVEDLVTGRPLSETVADVSLAGRRRTRAVLEDVVERLGVLASATAAPAAGPLRATLRGEHRRLEPLLGAVAELPSVLVHGDLASAHNVLVAGDRARLIDWETARNGLALDDVLPLLCLVSAQADGVRGHARQAEHVLRLCAGQAPGGLWLLRLVAAHCLRSQVPLGSAGALAALAWGSLASMPIVHAELAAADGREVAPWPTAASLVAAGWDSHPGLGLDWPALRAVAGGA